MFIRIARFWFPYEFKELLEGIYWNYMEKEIGSLLTLKIFNQKGLNTKVDNSS